MRQRSLVILRRKAAGLAESSNDASVSPGGEEQSGPQQDSRTCAARSRRLSGVRLAKFRLVGMCSWSVSYRLRHWLAGGRWAWGAMGWLLVCWFASAAPVSSWLLAGRFVSVDLGRWLSLSLSLSLSHSLTYLAQKKGPHRHLRSRPRPTRSLIAQLYPTAPSTHLAAVRLLARPTHAYRPWAGNKHPRLGTRVPATPGLVSTQPIAGVGDIWPGSSRLSVFQARLC